MEEKADERHNRDPYVDASSSEFDYDFEMNDEDTNSDAAVACEIASELVDIVTDAETILPRDPISRLRRFGTELNFVKV